MANIPIWPGSSSFAGISNPTPFAFFDTDTSFISDADKVSDFCAKRLGYPLVDIELQDVNFYACFEEATNEYGSQVYNFQIINNFHTLEGTTTGSDFNNQLISPNLGGTINISDQYGNETYGGGEARDTKDDMKKYPDPNTKGGQSTRPGMGTGPYAP